MSEADLTAPAGQRTTEYYAPSVVQQANLSGRSLPEPTEEAVNLSPLTPTPDPAALTAQQPYQGPRQAPLQEQAPAEPEPDLTDPTDQAYDFFTANGQIGELSDFQKEGVKYFEQIFGKNFYNQKFQGVNDYYQYVNSILTSGRVAVDPSTLGSIQEIVWKYMPPKVKEEYSNIQSGKKTEEAQSRQIKQIAKLRKSLGAYGDEFDVSDKMYEALGISKKKTAADLEKEELAKLNAQYRMKQTVERSGNYEMFRNTVWDPDKKSYVNVAQKIKDTNSEIARISTALGGPNAINLPKEAKEMLQSELQVLVKQQKEMRDKLAPTYIPLDGISDEDLTDSIVAGSMPWWMRIKNQTR